ncbi:MAG: hypothetical protein DRN15_11495 [Thermoprotei archaeon]|nr:MAG: hypothetical protein DRN15_11495 [Thermoprotei archaeon]
MSTLEYALVFTGLVAYLMLSLSLVIMPTPTFNLRVLLSAIASVTHRPTSEIVIRLYVPKGAIIGIHDNVMGVENYVINYGEVKDFISLGIVESYNPQRLELDAKLNSLRLTGPRLYVLKVSCPKAGNILIRIIEIRRA